MLDNLLRNARVHAPGARVRVGVAAGGDGTARITVDDDGPGIPPEEREAVLGRGVRSRTAVAPGSGLGLFDCLSACSPTRAPPSRASAAGETAGR